MIFNSNSFRRLAMILTWTVVCCLSNDSMLAWQEEENAGQGSETIDLFDGETLDGWAGDMRFWSVVDGAIVGQPRPIIQPMAIRS